MSDNHAEPALHLVYTRTTRLLSMGIKLVVVIEGKRRVRGSEGERDSFRKRRSGTAFWKACKSCEEMLQTLGVPVVKAKAEGEALCALLNQRGIVDGVISNDGDCLLFGAKVVYTRFSLENLDKSLVVRYDVSELRGCLQSHETEASDGGGGDEFVVSLERGDLISFALLTGSDLAGDGLPKVGHKKAIRFIKQCKLDYPLSSSTAAIDELKSWARTASVSTTGQDVTKEKGQERCCSLCCHPGDKRSHQKHGCEMCGTKPGEPCFASSAGDKFRNALRLKALAMVPKFDPTFVMEAYMNPNDNQIPIMLLGESARSLRMSTPSLVDMLKFPHIIKGQSLAVSKEHVKKSVAQLLARAELANHTKPPRTHASRKNRLSREKPVPTEITRKLVRNKTHCYEIYWTVNATTTDGEGNEIDGYEFSTIEPQALVEKRHADLVQRFIEREKEEAKQGDAEANRRRDFVSKLLDGAVPHANQDEKQQKKKGRRGVKRRSAFFDGQEHSLHLRSVPAANARTSQENGGDDVHNLMAVVNDSFKTNVRKNRVIKDVSIDKDEESAVSELTEPEVDTKMRQECSPCRDPIQDQRNNVSVPHVETSNKDEEPIEPRRLHGLGESQTPLDLPCKTAPWTRDESFPRLEQNAASDLNAWDKRSLFDETPPDLPRKMAPLVEMCPAVTRDESFPRLEQNGASDDWNSGKRSLFDETPLDFPCKMAPLVEMCPAVTRDESFPRLEQNTVSDDWNAGKRSLSDDYLEPSSAIKRLRWSILDPVDRPIPQSTQDVFLQQDYTAATPASQRHYYSIEASQEYIRNIHFMLETPLSQQQQMPVLTPGHNHSMVCDMGIQVEITPLVSSKYF